jgi:glucose-6-phosphate isomerase
LSPKRLAAPYGEAVVVRLDAFARDQVPARLWAHDPALWSADPAHQAVARNRLGWLDVASRMREAVPDLRGFASEAASEGFTHAVLLGMGGSSLAPDVLRHTFGGKVSPHPGGEVAAPHAVGSALELTVLDSTSPAAVRRIESSLDPARTLFLVSSKSGGTIEVLSFEARFHEWVSARRKDPGRAFAAITDPGTSLERLARDRGYRRTFLNPPDIGGRYSALSYFGLVPAALMGIDIAALLDHAEAEMRRSAAGVKPDDNPGFVLGAAMGELALRGRDKLTLVLGREIGAFGAWAEQLIAESTGKDGRGIVPIAGEPLGPCDVYGQDRAFVAVSVDPLPDHTQRHLESLERAGHPVLRWRCSSLAAMGEEFLRWEIATAIAGIVLGVDPFDEPNVTEAKQATQAVLDQAVRDGRFPTRDAVASRGTVRAEAPAAVAARLASHVTNGADPAAWAAALLSLVQPGDYVATLAYLCPTPARDAKLEQLRVAARMASQAATTVGYGPRFLHSTGQLHKGGPNTGVFLQLTADEGEDVPIPGRPYGFGTLIAAQAWGDFEVLEKRERRVLRVHLGPEPDRALDELVEAIQAARV